MSPDDATIVPTYQGSSLLPNPMSVVAVVDAAADAQDMMTIQKALAARMSVLKEEVKSLELKKKQMQQKPNAFAKVRRPGARARGVDPEADICGRFVKREVAYALLRGGSVHRACIAWLHSRVPKPQ